MPYISNKGTKMPESPIRKLVPFAEGAKKKGACSSAQARTQTAHAM